MSLQPLLLRSFEDQRFLVIDDDRAVLALVEGLLHAASVGVVVKAVSALAALNLFADQHKRFDCVVCDHSMTMMTGLGLLKEIRTGRYAHIPRDQCFLMLTAHGQEDVVRAALALDVNGYLRKPVTKDTLVKAIHRAFNRSIALKDAGEYSAVALPAEA